MDRFDSLGRAEPFARGTHGHVNGPRSMIEFRVPNRLGEFLTGHRPTMMGAKEC